MRSLALLLLVPLAMRPAPSHAETARITVLHTTDVHGSLAAWDDLTDRPANRGLEKIASMVRAVRGEGAPVLLLDAGDAIEGSPLVAIDQRNGATGPDPVTTVMSRMGYDAMAVGNHEFSFGRGGLERARRASTFPWLAANVTTSGGVPAFGTSIVKVLGGVRVGVVGLTTPAVPMMEDSAHWDGLAFGSPVEAARREVQRLRSAEKCDVVILLAHTGLEPRDSTNGAGPRAETPDENWGARLATDVQGVDLVILGHTHVVVPSLMLGTVLVTQAGKWAEALGRVDLELTRSAPGAAWSVSSRKAQAIAVTDSVASDTAIAALVAPLHEAARRALDERIGEASAEIGAPHGRFDDGSLWELIQKAQLEATNAEISLASLPDPAVRIGPGPITLRDVYRAYPYGNTLDVAEMTGADLVAALERSARYLAPYSWDSDRPLAQPGMPGFNFDVAEGIGYEVDLTRPEGERILNPTFHDHPLDPQQRYKVAVNSYRANGGGGFDMVRRAPRTATGRDVRDAIVAAIRTRRIVSGSFTRNWRLLPDYAAAPERALIDRLVRQHVVPREEVMRLDAFEAARRGDLAYWLARAWGWRESRLSGAFADVPDSLEPWLDGLLKRKVLGAQASLEWIQPFAAAGVGTALDWCDAAARAGNHMTPTPIEDASFRRGLLTGVSVMRSGARGAAFSDTLTRAQVLGMVANARFPTLRVLETTDFHGAILPGPRERRSGRAYGGTVALAGWIEKLRAENPEGTLVIDGGDCFQGTMISNLQYGRPVVEQMNALGYAACAVGNHDFDWTADTLARRARESRYAELGANCVERRTGRIPKPMAADTVVVRRGLKVAILGLCYRNTPTVTLPTNVAHLRFEDDSTTTARRVPELRRRERPDALVVVGHVPAESDSTRHARSGDLPRLAHVPGVDAFFGGHSHNQVVDRVNGVPIMIAGSHGQYVAVCDLVVDPVQHKVVESSTRLQATWADEITPDSAWVARVTRWNAAVGTIGAQPVARSARALTRGGPESAVGDLVADAMRAKSGADVALQNTGGLRADLPEGVVTKGSVYEVMPFDNTIFLQQLTGAELKLALEQGLRRSRVTQVSGIRWSYDLSRPELQRVLSVTLGDGTPLDESRTYTVASNNFMATGGDEYNALANGRNRRDTGLTVRDALEDYLVELGKKGPIDYATDGRIRKVEASR